VIAGANSGGPCVEPPIDGGFDGGTIFVEPFALVSIQSPGGDTEAEYWSLLEFSGASLQAGTLTSANTSEEFSSLVTFGTDPADAGAYGSWWQGFSASSPSTQPGAFSLTISSLGPSIVYDAGVPDCGGVVTNWKAPHGQFSATMPAVPGYAGTGTVTVDVSF
jgi:hypothetical protein